MLVGAGEQAVQQSQGGATAAFSVNAALHVASPPCTFLVRPNAAGTQKRWCPRRPQPFVLLIPGYSLSSAPITPFNAIKWLFYQVWIKFKITQNILNLNSYLNSFQKWIDTKGDTLSRGELLTHESQSPKGQHYHHLIPSLPTLILPHSSPFPLGMDDLAQSVMFFVHKGMSEPSVYVY